VDIDSGNYIHYNHGVGEIDALVRDAGHSSSLIYLRRLPDRDEFIAGVKNSGADILFFPANTHQWIHVKIFTRWIKESTTLPIIVGGIHVICDPEKVIGHDAVDYICPFEGDVAVPEFLDILQTGKDPALARGIWSKMGSRIIRNKPFPLLENLDLIPISKREIWDNRAIMIDSMFEISVMAGRGCPYACAYCANSARKKAYKGLGGYLRMRTPARVIKNIEVLEKQYYFKSIFIEDDIFTDNLDWAYEFCDLYKRRFKHPFKVYIHVEKVDKKILTTLKEAGCNMVMAGVEAGNQTLRKEVLGRNVTNREIIRTLGWCDEIGLKTWTFNIIGFPGETKSTVKELFKLNEKIAPNHSQISLFYPYPGTRLYDVCVKNGFITGKKRTNYFEESILDLPTIDKKELERSFSAFRQRAMEIQAKKEKRGYFDFPDNFSKGDVMFENDIPPGLIRTNVWGDNRLSILAHPRQSIVWKVDLLPDSRFRAACALDPLCLKWGGKGVEFQIHIRDENREKMLYSKYIDPKKNRWQNRWHEIDLDLKGWEGKASISLAAVPHKSGDLTGCWSVWATPHLTQGKDDE